MFDLAYLAFQINLESTADQPEHTGTEPEMNLEPQLASQGQGLAWQGLPNQLGIHSWTAGARALLGRAFRINLEPNLPARARMFSKARPSQNLPELVTELVGRATELVELVNFKRKKLFIFF